MVCTNILEFWQKSASLHLSHKSTGLNVCKLGALPVGEGAYQQIHRFAAFICHTPHIFFPLFSSRFDVFRKKGFGNSVLNNTNGKVVGDLFRYLEQTVIV